MSGEVVDSVPLTNFVLASDKMSIIQVCNSTVTDRGREDSSENEE